MGSCGDFFLLGKDGCFFCQITNDLFSGDQADKDTCVIHHGDKILIHGAGEQFFHGCGDADTGISVRMEDLPHGKGFQIPHGALENGGMFGIEQPPEEIALADSADVPTVPGDDRDDLITVVAHFFQSLSEGTVVIKESCTILGEKKISYVQFTFLFLRRRKAAGV